MKIHETVEIYDALENQLKILIEDLDILAGDDPPLCTWQDVADRLLKDLASFSSLVITLRDGEREWEEMKLIGPVVFPSLREIIEEESTT